MRLSRPLLAALLIVSCALPASAGNSVTRLGRDARGDAPKGLDLTYLDVGMAGRRTLEIRIGVDMLPVVRGYPDLPGIQWTFDVKRRTFVAEAALVGGEPAFFLFEKNDGAHTQVGSPKGTYEPDDGYIKILVPLKDIGARSGTRISGTGKRGTEDVDAHVHLVVADPVPDTMATTRDFVIP